MATPADYGALALQQPVVSGRDRYSQQLGCPNLLGNRLTIGLQAGNADLDGLDRSLPAFVDGATAGEASRNGRDGHEIAAAVLGLHHDCVRAHRIHRAMNDAPGLIWRPTLASDLGLGTYWAQRAADHSL